MAEYIWELAVAEYLAHDRGVFLNPQYLIGTPNEWEAYADFLALDFPKRQAWMVEVTTAPGRKIFAKISQFQSEYAPRIRVQLKNSQVIKGENPECEWTIGLWVFAPGASLTKIQSRMDVACIQPSVVTALLDTLAPSAWSDRFR